MDASICPFCGAVIPNISETLQTRDIKFNFYNGIYDSDWGWNLALLRCPGCEKISYTAVGIGNMVKGKTVKVFPESSAIQFPDYVPQAIREDYEEAYAICGKSPKAAATLARRCLQGMIHDYWNIHEKNLNAEVTRLKEKVPEAQWKAIDAVRGIGNIGAHMEHDVNLIIEVMPDEAETLLKLIEHLISKWYVDRHQSEDLYELVTKISSEKMEQRKK